MKTRTTIQREFKGTVLSAGMHKTITVAVHSMKLNKKYQKKYRVTTTYHVHDEQNEAKVGNVVRFVECRPLSKTKRWRLVELIK